MNRENKNLIGQVRGGHDQTGGEVMVVGIIPSHLFQSETSDVEVRLEKTMTKMKEWIQGSGENEEIGWVVDVENFVVPPFEEWRNEKDAD